MSTVSDFWDSADVKGITGPPLTDEMVRAAEAKLGYKLPESYVRLLRIKNGGSPRRKCHSTGRTGWADDHAEINCILGIGGIPAIDSDYSGSQFMIREWGYPDVGIYFGHAPSAGHDGFMFDYRECGPSGEPSVIHVDTESEGPQVTVLAPNFETFALGLVDCAAFHDRINRAMDELDNNDRGTG
jgi:hypothetical protein